MQVLRTVDERFENLPGFNFAPHYIEINGLRMHYLDEGSTEAAPVLMLHGEPSWCYLYRKMVPLISSAQLRAIAPDLIGFGRSDKLAERADYSYQFHVDCLTEFIKKLDLKNITLMCQDWGGLIGLRVAAENPERFTGIVAANTGLPTGDQQLPEMFYQWQQFSQTVPEFPVGDIIQMGCKSSLSPEVIAAYNAPFPDETYKAGARAFPLLVPTRPDDPAADANRRAWQVLNSWQKPFLTAFSDGDPITKGGEKIFQQNVPGCQNMKHTIIKNGGHFLQEDQGEILAELIINFVETTKE